MSFTDTVRVIFNSLSFFILIAIAYYIFKFNPIIGVVFALASIDQAEDVYRILSGRHPVPVYLIPFDLIFETVIAVTGAFMFLMSLIYWYSFESWFFAILSFVSISIVICAISDISEDIRILSAKLYLSSASTSKASIAETNSFKFFRRLK